MKGLFSIFERTCGGCGTNDTLGNPPEATFKHIFVLQPIPARSDAQAAEITQNAMTLMAQSRIADAVREFHLAQALAPQHHQTYSNLGCAYRAKSDDDEALKWFREAHRLAPQDEVATLALAFLEQRSGQADEAQWLIVNFLQEVNPNHVNALSQLAQLYEDRMHWQRAAGCYRRLLEAEPHKDDWATRLSTCEQRLEVGQMVRQSPPRGSGGSPTRQGLVTLEPFD